jgi:hypothetical protein
MNLSFFLSLATKRRSAPLGPAEIVWLLKSNPNIELFHITRMKPNIGPELYRLLAYVFLCIARNRCNFGSAIKRVRLSACNVKLLRDLVSIVAVEMQTMTSVCIVELLVTVNNFKILEFAQKLFYGRLI